MQILTVVALIVNVKDILGEKSLAKVEVESG